MTIHCLDTHGCCPVCALNLEIDGGTRNHLQRRPSTATIAISKEKPTSSGTPALKDWPALKRSDLVVASRKVLAMTGTTPLARPPHRGTCSIEPPRKFVAP